MNVTCDCGKRMMVSDALAGKTVRCSGCGESIYVAPAPETAGAAGSKKQEEAGGFYVSPAVYIGISSVVAVLILGLVFYFGPMRVGRQWDDIDMKARSTVTNVITYAIKAYLSERGEFDPLRHAPAIERDDLIFSKPYLSMSMPKKVRFDGHSNNGGFTGFYDTETGEIEADVEAGGNMVAGLAVLKKPTTVLHMTGREVNNDPVVEVDGKPLKFIPMVMPEGKHR
jgi:hypothetical protein